MKRSRARKFASRGANRYVHVIKRPRVESYHSKTDSSTDPSNSVEFLRKLEAFRKSGDFCDGSILSADGKIYRIHRILLAVYSEFFRAAFSSSLSTNRSELTLHFPSKVVDCVVDFCYTGRCVLTFTNVQQLLPAADQLGLLRLVDLCCKFLGDNLNVKNAYGIYKFATTYSCYKIAQLAKRKILKDFTDYYKTSDEFYDMSIDDLVIFLCDNNLNVPSEIIVFLAMSEWINHKPEERNAYVNRLWACVRFEYIPPELYRTEVLSGAVVDNVTSMNLWSALELQKQASNTTSLTNRPRVPHYVIFAIGGWSTGSPTNHMETYDVRADRWFRSNLRDSVPRAYHGAVSVDNLIYVVGGFGGGYMHFKSVRCFDPVRKEWSDKASMEEERCYVSCVVVGNDIYAIGGHTGSDVRVRTVERYSVAENRWIPVPPMNKERSDFGATAINGQIFVCGGFDGVEILKSAECFDVDSKTWHRLPNMNVRRSGFRLAYFNGYIYAIGGSDGDFRWRTVERLNVQRPNEWLMDVPRMRTQRSNFACTVFENKIFVIGGFDGISTVRTCEVFDGENWTEIASMNVNRSALAVAVCEGLKNAADYTATGLGNAQSRTCFPVQS